MPCFDVPFVIRHHATDRIVTVRLTHPAPWGNIRPLVCHAAGLPADSSLHLGIGPVPESALVGAPPLLAGCLLSTEPAITLDDPAPLTLVVIAGPDAGKSSPLTRGSVDIGRDPGSTLHLSDEAASRQHARVRATATGFVVEDRGSTNGVRIDGIRTGCLPPSPGAPAGADGRPPFQPSADGPASAALGLGSLLRIGNNLLQSHLRAGLRGAFRPDGRGHVVRTAAIPRALASPPPPVPPPPKPPERPAKRALPILSSAAGAIVGGVLALVLRQPMFLAFAAFGPLMAIGTALSDRLQGRRSFRRLRAEYRDDLAAWGRSATEVDRLARIAAWQRCAGPEELTLAALTHSAALWNSRPTSADYLTVCVGIASGTRTLAPSGGVHGEAAGPSAAVSEPQGHARGVPVDMPARYRPGGVTAFVGDRGRDLARYVIAQLACAHSPVDVAITAIGSRTDLRPMHLLPHASGLALELGAGPAAATDGSAAPAAPRHLGGLADAASGGVAPCSEWAPGRDIVIVLDGAEAARGDIGVAARAAALAPPPSAAARIPGASGPAPIRPSTVMVLELVDTPDALTPDAHLLAEPAHLLGRPGREAVTPAADTHRVGTGSVDSYSGMDAAQFERACLALAPLRDHHDTRPSAHTAGPGSIASATLEDLLGPIDVAAITARWESPSLRATLGTTISDAGGAGGESVTSFDLDSDGPHLLIAGTTGAGKSELLLTLICSWAASAPPSELTMLLIDYKGGAAFGSATELPHVVGMITDLDQASSARALTSLRAELRRREGASTTPGMRRPRLVVVIDEFATLAVEQPEFLAGLVDIAQRGRSLGMHLIAATQRPAGVVSPAMRANIGARICLRVTDAADSVDVLGTADAALLSRRTPGRAILKAGDRTVTFQAGRVSVPRPPDIRVFGPDGTETMADPASDPVPARTILAELVESARCAHIGAPPVPRPWIDPLPSRIESEEAGPSLFALVDEPETSARRDLAIFQESALVLGPPRSGRSMALRRLALGAASRGEELLIVDGSGSLADLAASPWASSYLTRADPSLISRLLDRLAAPNQGPLSRHRRLVIDDLDLVVAEMDRVDFGVASKQLTALVAGSGSELRVCASAAPSFAHQRIAAAFPETVTLVGVAGQGSVASAPPGRGHWRGLELQVIAAPALPPMKTASIEPLPWPDRMVVRPLPEQVLASELPPARADRVPWGRAGDDAGFLGVDLVSASGAIVVAGPRGSGVTTALDTLSRGALAAGIPVIRVHADAAPTCCAGARDITCAPGPEQLRAALARHEGPLLLVADHGRLADDHPAASVLDRFLQVCEAGQHLAIGIHTAAATRARRGHLRAALDYRNGLLLDPDHTDGQILDVQLPRRREARPPGRGFWIRGGTATPIQIAWGGPAAAERGGRGGDCPPS